MKRSIKDLMLHLLDRAHLPGTVHGRASKSALSWQEPGQTAEELLADYFAASLEARIHKARRRGETELRFASRDWAPWYWSLTHGGPFEDLEPRRMRDLLDSPSRTIPPGVRLRVERERVRVRVSYFYTTVLPVDYLVVTWPGLRN